MLKKILSFVPVWIQSLIYYTASCTFLLGSGIAVLLYWNQNRLLYHPVLPNLPRDPAGNPEKYRRPSEWDMDYEDVEIVAEDGMKLHCWFIHQPDPKDRPTVVFFQENAGNMGLRLPSMHTLFDRLGVNIFMVSYRGYGRSGGSPEEQGLKLDAVAVMNHVSRMPQIDNKRILVLGRSLGGAVGTYIAANHPEHVKGLVLENTFTSIPDMVDVVMPWVAPLKFLVLRISWASIDLIPKVTAPVLFISGLRDELVPPEHMKRLFDAAEKSIYKQWHPVPQGMHNDTCMRDPTYVATWQQFMDKIGC